MPSPDKQLYEFAPFLLDAGSRIFLKGRADRATPVDLKLLLLSVRKSIPSNDKNQFLTEVRRGRCVRGGGLLPTVHLLRRAMGIHSSEPPGADFTTGFFQHGSRRF